jgi:hypothetical protein
MRKIEVPNSSMRQPGLSCNVGFSEDRRCKPRAGPRPDDSGLVEQLLHVAGRAPGQRGDAAQVVQQ